MSEQDQRAMYSLRDAIQSLSSNISGQWESQQRILMALEQLVIEVQALNEKLERKASDDQPT